MRELAANHSDTSIQSLIEKHSAKISEQSQLKEKPHYVKLPSEFQNTTEGKLIEGVVAGNWGKVNSALMLGADTSVTYEGKTLLELAVENSDTSIIRLIKGYVRINCC
ncbi:MAG: hypothetical protein ACPF9E_19895 [Alteromonas oceani]